VQDYHWSASATYLVAEQQEANRDSFYDSCSEDNAEARAPDEQCCAEFDGKSTNDEAHFTTKLVQNERSHQSTDELTKVIHRSYPLVLPSIKTSVCDI